ncbi:MAG: tryptophan synthase subunit beta, partial [Cellvibrionaceae bacterium]|nr:tryptophan synthase subunit beta [Cellvibrionaceae bacterium]
MDLFDFKPGREGYYGDYGGSFLPEILTTTVEELKAAFAEIKHDPSFWQEFEQLMQSYSGRPTPVSHLANLSA